MRVISFVISTRDLDSKITMSHTLKFLNSWFGLENYDEPYTKISEIFFDVLYFHSHLKQESNRVNHALFMCKDLSKATMTNSKVNKRYLLNQSDLHGRTL